MQNGKTRFKLPTPEEMEKIQEESQKYMNENAYALDKSSFGHKFNV